MITVRLVFTTMLRMVYPFLSYFAAGLGVGLPAMAAAMTLRSIAGVFSPFLASVADSRGRKAGMLLGILLFTFGVGFDVNAPLLERIAAESRGRVEFVLPKEDVEVKIGRVFKQLSGPVLADPELRVRAQLLHGLVRFDQDVHRDLAPDVVLQSRLFDALNGALSLGAGATPAPVPMTVLVEIPVTR